ncbi:ferredoxin reductase [Iamia majanohamensis]|uniref:Ferredoxin reductase n=1 Tax=Iamia majanohamensis TaxID=467976 RepID=A0AAE9YID2_9ACTN|nr:ferredoxin reductase [Iamia majanohamensis]WCO68456.1 ferredoxin reductase [Iamia majanohamensis]
MRIKERVGEVVDAFATPLRASHYVELVNPLWSSHRLQARVEDVWDETPDARTLTLRPGRGWRRHRAGQHIRVGVPIDGRRFTRTYSISSSPERRDGCITITVKVLEGGRMSGHLVRDLRPGTHLPIGLPQGDFLVPEAVPVRPLLVTAGSGITPVMSMLRTWALVGNMPDVAHLHYAPTRHDVIFGAELERLAAEHRRYDLHTVLTRSDGGSHFCREQLDALCPDWQEREVWVCGPQGLIEAVEDHHRDAPGARPVHVERFRASLAEIDADARGGTATFLSGGTEVEADADATTPLLRVAEDAGLNPAHGCRMGICHTCDVPLATGSVRDLRTGDLIDEPGRAVQICTAAAAGDCTIDLQETS